MSISGPGAAKRSHPLMGDATARQATYPLETYPVDDVSVTVDGRVTR